MTPDLLSEKYYDVSPYAFCNNNPVNFVDPDGRSTYVKALEDGDLNIYVVTYDDNGVIYTSARDIGNMMAGYVAGQKGLAWHIARVGFDGYQSISESGLKWTPEGASTQNAQLLGCKAGFMVYYKQRLHIQQ